MKEKSPENVHSDIDDDKSELPKALILSLWSMGRNLSITWELVRNADSQAPSQTLTQNLPLPRFPGDSSDIKV